MTASCTQDRCETCPGKVVCRCLQVTEEALVNLITHLDLRTIRDVKKYTGAGDGCTCCHPEIQAHLERYSLVVTQQS